MRAKSRALRVITPSPWVRAVAPIHMSWPPTGVPPRSSSDQTSAWTHWRLGDLDDVELFEDLVDARPPANAARTRRAEDAVQQLADRDHADRGTPPAHDLGFASPARSIATGEARVDQESQGSAVGATRPSPDLPREVADEVVVGRGMDAMISRKRSGEHEARLPRRADHGVVAPLRVTSNLLARGHSVEDVREGSRNLRRGHPGHAGKLIRQI